MTQSRTTGAHPRTRSLATAAVVALALLWPTSLTAQGLGLEVDAGYRALAGEDFDGLEDGWATHALGSVAWHSGWEAGIGVGISFHDPAATDRDGDLTEVIGFGRYRFGVPGGSVRHLHPFLEARGGLLRFSTSAAGDEDVSQDGALLGGQIGLEYWLSDEVALTGATGLDYLTLSAGDGLPDRSGWSFRPQVGLKLRY